MRISLHFEGQWVGGHSKVLMGSMWPMGNTWASLKSFIFILITSDTNAHTITIFSLHCGPNDTFCNFIRAPLSKWVLQLNEPLILVWCNSCTPRLPRATVHRTYHWKLLTFCDGFQHFNSRWVLGSNWHLVLIYEFQSSVFYIVPFHFPRHKPPSSSHKVAHDFVG